MADEERKCWLGNVWFEGQVTSRLEGGQKASVESLHQLDSTKDNSLARNKLIFIQNRMSSCLKALKISFLQALEKLYDRQTI